jgi:PAS domain-containing protein
MEKRYVHARGHLVSVLLNVSLVSDGQGQPLYFIAQIQDITERKRAEEEIKFKNTVLQTQQETSPDAILVVDENSQITSYNQRFLDLWRLSPQLVSARVDGPVLQAVVDQVENSEAFVARIQYLYAHRADKSREEIPLRLQERTDCTTGASGISATSPSASGPCRNCAKASGASAICWETWSWLQ